MAGTSSAPFGGRGTLSPRPRVGGRDGHPAEGLDPLGRQMDQLQLLVGMLVQQQVVLVERGLAYQPAVLLAKAVRMIESARTCFNRWLLSALSTISSSPSVRTVRSAC